MMPGRLVPVQIVGIVWAMKQTTGGMNPAGFAALNEAERGNFWFEPRNRLIVGLLDKYFPTAKTFMEIGCGTGFVLSAIASSRTWQRLYGSELHAEGLAFAKPRLAGRATLMQMDARAIPADLSLDVFGAFDVLEHIPEDEAVLAGIARALNPGGGLLITVPQHRWLWSRVDDEACHVRRYTARELQAKVEAAGFHVLFSGSYTFALLPLILASRLRKQKDVSASEFSLPSSINALFRGVLNAEVAMTLAGVHYPVGGSRVMVAQKI
jgi:SAM-dependent methyltransferase